MDASQIEILNQPDTLVFQNTTDPLSSSDLTKFISQCLGLTTQKPQWNGLLGYKNIAKNIPQSIVVFQMPRSLQAISPLKFPFEIDSDLTNEFLETKEIIHNRFTNEIVKTDYIKLFDKGTSLDGQIDRLENYLKKFQMSNDQQITFLWFKMLSNSKVSDSMTLDDLGTRFQKILNRIVSTFGNNIMVFSIYDDTNDGIKERRIRQTKNSGEQKNRKVNLAYEYSIDFHTSFVSIGFTSILFILAVFVISVSMWNIDPGRDSIIYRLTSQKIKKDQ